MFSTREGEALPVRTPENSFCTTSSVFSIFSSASNRISSSAIRGKYQSFTCRATANRSAEGALKNLRVQSSARRKLALHQTATPCLPLSKELGLLRSQRIRQLLCSGPLADASDCEVRMEGAGLNL